jgi:hypothetical protein
MQRRIETEDAEMETESKKLLTSSESVVALDTFGSVVGSHERMSEQELLRAIQRQVDAPPQKSADADDIYGED